MAVGPEAPTIPTFEEARHLVENQAARPESFNVTSYAGSIVVGTRAVNLDALSSSTVLFSWDTTGVSPGSYDIRIETSAVPHDANLTANTYSAGSVLLSTPELRCQPMRMQS